MEYIDIQGVKPVSRLVLGCEFLGGADWGEFDPKSAEAAIKHALDQGVNAFDTADVYGLGLSEERLSDYLGEKRHDVIVITKAGVNWHKPVPPGERARCFFDASPKHLRESVAGSLKRLKLDRLPLYLVHRPDPKTPIQETLDCLRELNEKGLIGAYGVSNFSGEQLSAALAAGPVRVLESELSLIDRRTEFDALPVCRAADIPLMAYGTLAQGLLTGKYTKDSTFPANDRRHRLPHFQPDRIEATRGLLDRLIKKAQELGRTPSQVAIRWALDTPGVGMAVVGAKTPAQVEANCGALGWSLSDEERVLLAGDK